jgi:hypothetical protein
MQERARITSGTGDVMAQIETDGKRCIPLRVREYWDILPQGEVTVLPILDIKVGGRGTRAGKLRVRR